VREKPWRDAIGAVERLPGAVRLPTTVTGAERLMRVPSPSWPTALSPQQTTWPPARRAHAKSQPTAISTASVRPVTSLDVVFGLRPGEMSTVPVPSSPN
jgi:hypothetical protein